MWGDQGTALRLRAPEVNFGRPDTMAEVATVYYTSSTSRRGAPTAAQAPTMFAPTTTGAYFSKITASCFTDQRLSPGQRSGEMWRCCSAYDPDELKSEDSDAILSQHHASPYTFLPARDPGTGCGQNGASPARDGSENER